jgi:flagellar motor switch protein FliG
MAQFNPHPVPVKGNSKAVALTGRQKVATVLVALGPEISSQILTHFEESEVEQIALDISTMRKMEPTAVNDVIEEFYQLAKANEYLATGGLTYTREILEKAFGADKADEIITRLTAMMEQVSMPFDAFRQADPAQVANLIQGEHPQTISLILAYLRPEQAAVVISNLPEDLQIEVSTRMATMERAGLEVVKEVEAVLYDKFSAVLYNSEKHASVGGVKALAEVLNRVDRSTERNIVENLERLDPELAESVKKLMFVFDDIVQLDDRALALKGAVEEVKERIFRNMSERAGRMLRDDIDTMGPVRLKDVEEVQQKIVNVVRRLEETGEIIISRGGDDIVI